MGKLCLKKNVRFRTVGEMARYLRNDGLLKSGIELQTETGVSSPL